MAIESDEPEVILEALRASDAVDARGLSVAFDEGDVVVRGTVATYEEASAALRIAGEHAPGVRNELRVDPNLREGADPAVASDSGDALRRDGLRGSSFDPLERADDLVTDVQESLDENLPWDPPHEPVEVPTRAESRGVADPNAADDDNPDAGLLDETPDAGAMSLPDMSAAELERAAHPEPQQEAG